MMSLALEGQIALIADTSNCPHKAADPNAAVEIFAKALVETV